LERDFLIKSFGKWGNELYNLARGIDHRPVSSKRQPKSIGEETTFATDQQDPEKLRRSLAEFAQVLWQRLEQKGLLGRTITLKVRYSNFVTITRSHTSPDPATSANQIFQRALYLLTKIDLKHQKVRLIGLTVSNFIYPGEPYQLTLW
jgi:DNA polymerase-4